MKLKQRHKEVLFLAGFLLACAILAALSAESVTEVKDIKYGRKDLLRNELVTSVIESNNQLFKQVLINNGYQIELLNSKINGLEKELAECRASKNKK